MNIELDFCFLTVLNTFYWANYSISDGGNYSLGSCHGLTEADVTGTVNSRLQY